MPKPQQLVLVAGKTPSSMRKTPSYYPSPFSDTNLEMGRGTSLGTRTPGWLSNLCSSLALVSSSVKWDHTKICLTGML